MSISSQTKDFKSIGKAISILHPDLLEEIRPLLKKPEPVLIHFMLLPALLSRFCTIKNVEQENIIGTGRGGQACDIKRLFIAVILSLYDPMLLTGIHSEMMRANLATELSKTLQVDRVWISQQSTDIRRFLNPHTNKRIYEDYKAEVARIAEILANEFKQ